LPRQQWQRPCSAKSSPNLILILFFLPKFFYFGVEHFDWCQQGNLIDGEAFVQLTSLYHHLIVQTLFIYKTSFLNEEVNRTEPFLPKYFFFLYFFFLFFNWRQQGSLLEGEGSVQLTSLCLLDQLILIIQT
jgi:hypothetical protein